jgi:hypothetical protein
MMSGQEGKRFSLIQRAYRQNEGPSGRNAIRDIRIVIVFGVMTRPSICGERLQRICCVFRTARIVNDKGRYRQQCACFERGFLRLVPSRWQKIRADGVSRGASIARRDPVGNAMLRCSPQAITDQSCGVVLP